MNANVAARDTLFVELAIRERRRLVTFDARLLAALPEHRGSSRCGRRERG
jgi:predicted nucleic acid-binding protein